MIEIISDGDLDCSDPMVVAMLMQALASWPTMYQEESDTRDFFDQKPEDLIDSNKDNPAKFISKLNYSNWSKYFVHGADMLPWLVAGFKNFLENNNLSLNTIQKIRFKKKVTGNVEYSIFTTKNPSLEQRASVLWEFVADDKSVYYFYGKQVGNDNKFRVKTNDLFYRLISRWGPLAVKDKTPNKEAITFLKQSEATKSKYITKITENTGYIRSTLLDIVNVVFQSKFDTTWLIISYHDLFINTQKFDPSNLLDGTCTIEVEMSDDYREMEGWWWHRINFVVSQKDAWEIASWSTVVLSRRKCV